MYATIAMKIFITRDGVARLYTFVDYAGEERMVPVGWILHLVGRWYLQWRLGRLSVVKR